MTRCLGIVGVIVGLFFGLVSAQGTQGEPLGTLTLRRNERTISVLQYAPSAEGGEFRLRVPNCEEGVRLSTVFAPAPYLVETLVNETRITSSVVLDRRPPRDEGGQDRATLEMFGGNLEVDLDTLCPQNVSRSEVPEVTILEGRTTAIGTVFNYDNETGIGLLSGPVDLDRVAEGDSPALEASAEALEFNVDTDLSTLSGQVRVVSDGRVSEADTLELDEQAGQAVLKGSPARSEQDQNVLEGDTLLYFLDSNDVVVIGNVKGVLELDLE
jgi:lipopolysaccharide export system protein LptA